MQGLHGARIEVDFVPPGTRRVYHRVHAVIVAGDSLVHVMYTAGDPDLSFEALNLVLGSLRHKEA